MCWCDGDGTAHCLMLVMPLPSSLPQYHYLPEGVVGGMPQACHAVVATTIRQYDYQGVRGAVGGGASGKGDESVAHTAFQGGKLGLPTPWHEDTDTCGLSTQQLNLGNSRKARRTNAKCRKRSKARKMGGALILYFYPTLGSSCQPSA